MAGTIYAGNPFTISVLASDPDNFPGTPLTFMWTQTAGPATALFSDIFAAQPNITCPVPGAYTFQVSVSDGITPTVASTSVNVAGFYTGQQSFTATCPSGEIGSSVTASATYTSIVSQPDADAKALAAATQAAQAGLQCTSTPAIWSLKVAAALGPTETLTYKLFLLDAGIPSNPHHATLLRAYPLDGHPYHPGDTIDYTSIVTAYTEEESFLWQVAYSNTTPGSGSGTVSYSRLLPVNPTVLQVDPSYTLIGTAYSKELPVTPGSGYPTSVVTGVPVLDSTTAYIDAPNPQWTYLALQDNFVSPPKNRLWIYNWDERVGVNGGAPPGSIATYDFLKVSWLAAGTLAAPITETTLYEASYSVALYGANLYDDALNYLSLDGAVAAFPPNTGGNLIVRRGTFDPVGQVVNYGPDSVVLRTTGALAGTGTITINSLSGNANIPENINGVATYTANAIGRIFISAGAFAIRNYNWRASVNSTYNTILVYQLIGSAGNFTGITASYAFPAQSPDSPTGFYEIPLPTNANGISFAVYAGVQTGVNQYTLIADSFPLGTVYGTNWVDAHGFGTTPPPFAVTNLNPNVIPGLPSAQKGVFTITDNSRQVILERAAPYG
jgi:hypothetical protein